MKNQTQNSDKKQKRVKSSRQKKVNLVFDEEKRRQFLGGFRKRKLQRQKKAQEELQQQLKEEKKRIKKNAKDSYKKWISYRAVPELEELLAKKEYEEEGHTVSILELKVSDLEQQSSLIGENIVKYDDDDDDENKNGKNEESDDNCNSNEVPGMEIVRKPLKKKKIEKELPEKKPTESGKNIKKAIKRIATKEVQKSKAFQQKQKMEHLKNKKKMRQKVKNQNKLKKKDSRNKRSA
ncbi:nucleolar protein 12 [Leptopilina heterotoma]|uniref:nucleolar protein 12 n=1 Tax=Leptopilina heterotoma TaxID=63436 RepID=UPI001CA8E24D|nr:nucleolar protein 12 [Leptopilina heterotoma]